MRLASAAVTVTMVALAVAPVRAQPARPVPQEAPVVELDYRRGAGAQQCADAAVLRDAVVARLGLDPFAGVGPATSLLVVELAERDGHLLGTIGWRDDQGNAPVLRELAADAGDCEALIAALALSISLAVEPLLDSGSANRPRSVTTLPAPPVNHGVVRQPPPPSTAVVADPVGPGVQLSWQLGADLMAATGLTPQATAAVAVGGGIRAGAFVLELRAQYAFATTTEVRGAEVDAAVWSGSVLPCVRGQRYGACAIGSLGGVRGRGHAPLQSPQRTWTLYAAAGGRVFAEWPLARQVAVRLQADTQLTLARTTLTVSGQPVWRTPLVSAAVGISGIFHFD